MTPLMECDVCETEVVDELNQAETRLDDFWGLVARAEESALFLDFDGTLAPFRIDPLKVRPWAGVIKLLDEIQEMGRTRLAIVSGRPAQQVAAQLGMQRLPEIWGLHGAERFRSNGKIETAEFSTSQQVALDAAKVALQETGLVAKLGLRLEEKWNAIAVHWRGKSEHSVRLAREGITNVMRPFAEDSGLDLLLFDCGAELRAGRNKGDTVRLLLEELGASTPVAFLGDDVTDENAFEALGDRGLTVLVRREWRPTLAQMWLRPPVQMRAFLAAWLSAVSR